MKIIKRENIAKESAHGGAGARKVLANSNDCENLDAITHGFLSVGGAFDWHEHDEIVEIMYVLHGAGIVSDEDGEYMYADGDAFVFPANVQHRIENKSDIENEMIFVRIKK